MARQWAWLGKCAGSLPTAARRWAAPAGIQRSQHPRLVAATPSAVALASCMAGVVVGKGAPPSAGEWALGAASVACIALLRQELTEEQQSKAFGRPANAAHGNALCLLPRMCYMSQGRCNICATNPSPHRTQCS